MSFIKKTFPLPAETRKRMEEIQQQINSIELASSMSPRERLAAITHIASMTKVFYNAIM